MDLPEKAYAEFKELYNKEFSTQISQKDAKIQADKLLLLFATLSKIKKRDVDLHHGAN